MAGVASSVDIYKALCKITSLPSQIIKSESNVSQPVQILENDYINPFSITLKATKLFILFYLFIYLFIYLSCDKFTSCVHNTILKK